MADGQLSKYSNLPSLILKEEHHYTLDQLENNKGVVFLTGKAGTGKSTILNLFKRTTSKNCIILAPTGVAAINVKGQTIHSFFKFPSGLFSANEYKIISKKMVNKIDLIIIDEISMVRADLLDHIDQILKISTGKQEAFGGIPMIWIGDLFQLPPIVNREEKVFFEEKYETPYFYSSHVFKKLNTFELIELNQVFRQKEKEFISLLNRMRRNDLEDEDLDFINQHCKFKKGEISDLEITLCSTNAAANQINSSQLAKITNPPHIYKAKVNGQVLPSQYPIETDLILKKEAQIMLVKNDPAKRFVNGSLGIIMECGEETIKVKLDGQADLIEIERTTWEMIKYQLSKDGQKIIPEVIGSFTQFPIKLAWAITIHKSQGKSFDKVIIDLGVGAFENGQSYVAFSRCRTLEGIRLVRPLRLQDIRTDERVADFLRNWS